MENIVFLYVFFTGCVYTSWLWETTNNFFDKILNILFGFINGWYITPILIGKVMAHLIDTLEVKEVDTWHLQEKENIYDAVKDWGHYTFACIMKDGTIQRFNGCLDEDCEGGIHTHIDGVNDDYDNVDDIVKWTDLTKEIEWVSNKAQKGE